MRGDGGPVSNSKTYAVRLFCSNCGLRMEVKLGKGTARVRREAPMLVLCPRCECRFAYHEPLSAP